MVGPFLANNKASWMDGWMEHPGITKVVLALGLTALASNNLFSTTSNGQVSRNNFLQHSIFNFFIFWPRKIILIYVSNTITKGSKNA